MRKVQFKEKGQNMRLVLVLSAILVAFLVYVISGQMQKNHLGFCLSMLVLWDLLRIAFLQH